MPDIEDGESVAIQGSAKDPYILKNLGGVYSCSCPAWRTQSQPIEKRTCKHLRKYRGDEAETERLGGELPGKPAVSRRKPAAKGTDGGAGSDDSGASDVPGFLLAHSWDNFVDLTGWWMSEKLDGVRAYWDGSQFISRQGNVYMAPDWFIEDLPRDIHLDGELWIGRKAFQRTVSVVRRQDKSKEWEAVKYVVFDAPQLDDVFEARMAYLQQCLDEIQPRYATPHAQERCKGSEHLLAELNRVEEGGGEGLMLRQPSSKYESGRSSTLLKVKRFHDAEARVLEYLPGTGKHKGRMGALSVELNNGIKFAIGTGFSDRERDNPPAIGSIVTFRYQELTDRGVPRFPSFVRVRTDIDQLPADLKGDVATSVTTIEISSDDGENTSTKTVAAVPPAKPVEEGKDVDTTGSAASETEEQKQAASNVLNFAPRSGTPAITSARKLDDTIPRYFEFTEGNSSKFWSIWRDGCDVIVQYGRIGLGGQEKPKSFDDDDKAKKYYADIVEEKLEKGYIEKTGPGGGRVDDDDADQGEDDADSDESDVGDEDASAKSSSPGNEVQLFRRAQVGAFNCYCSECYPELAAASPKGAVQNPAAKQALTAPGAKTGNGSGAKSGTATGAKSKPGSTAVSTKSTTSAKSATGVATAASGVRYFEFVEGSSSKFWSIWMSGNDVTVKYGRIGTNGQEKAKSFPNANAAQKYYDEIIEEKVEKGYEEQTNEDDDG